MSRTSLKILQIVITLCLLGLVAHQAGLFTPAGREQLVELIKNADLKWLVAALLIGIAVNLVSSFKWYCLSKSIGLQAGYFRLFAYYVIGQFYNMFLPTSVGGDVVRSYELGKHTGRQADALASVFVERLTGVITLLVLALLAFLMQISRFDQQWIIGSLVGFSAGLLLLVWISIDGRVYNFLKTILKTRHRIFEFGFAKADKFVAGLGRYGNKPMSIVWAFVNSVFFYFVAVVNVFVTALVFNADIHFMDVLIATPIIMLLMNIPLSMGNLGLMEFAYVNVFQLFGYSPSFGLSVALLMRLKSFFDAAIGGGLYPIVVTHSRR